MRLIVLIFLCTLTEHAFAQVPSGAVLGGFKNVVWSDYFHTFDQSGTWAQTWWLSTPTLGNNHDGSVTRVPGAHIALVTNGGPYGSMIINHPDVFAAYESSFLHGYFEASIRLATTTGAIANNWAAFYLVSKSFLENTDVAPSGTAKRCELDVFEAHGHNQADTTEHWWTMPAGGQWGDQNNQATSLVFNLPTDPLDGNYHTYGMLWQYGKVTWYYDNVLINSFDSFPGCDTTPMSIIFGAHSYGSDEQETDVQWVRVWQ